MIVEFIGCTGAGKTTLIDDVQQRLVNVASVTTSVDLAAGVIGLKGVTHPTVQNLIQEVVGFPFFMGTLYKYREFLLHTIKLFLRNSRFSIQAINNLRSLERKIGMYELMRHDHKDRIILVDEGPILAAHMFIFTGAPYSREEISRFTDLLPLPDLVVYIRASIDALIQRTLQRADPPREINTKDPAQIETYIKSAVAIFDQVVRAENIRYRLLIVESIDFSDEGYSEIVENICQTILNCEPRIEGKEK